MSALRYLLKGSAWQHRCHLIDRIFADELVALAPYNKHWHGKLSSSVEKYRAHQVRHEVVKYLGHFAEGGVDGAIQRVGDEFRGVLILGHEHLIEHRHCEAFERCFEQPRLEYGSRQPTQRPTIAAKPGRAHQHQAIHFMGREPRGRARDEGSGRMPDERRPLELEVGHEFEDGSSVALHGVPRQRFARDAAARQVEPRHAMGFGERGGHVLEMGKIADEAVNEDERISLAFVEIGHGSVGQVREPCGEREALRPAIASFDGLHQKRILGRRMPS